MLNSNLGMVRTRIVKELLPDRRSSIRLAKRGSQGNLCRASLGIQVSNGVVESSKHPSGEVFAYLLARFRERPRNIGFVRIDMQDTAA
jgi:hypothetical protein